MLYYNYTTISTLWLLPTDLADVRGLTLERGRHKPAGRLVSATKIELGIYCTLLCSLPSRSVLCDASAVEQRSMSNSIVLLASKKLVDLTM